MEFSPKILGRGFIILLKNLKTYFEFYCLFIISFSIFSWGGDPVNSPLPPTPPVYGYDRNSISKNDSVFDLYLQITTQENVLSEFDSFFTKKILKNFF